MAVGSLGAGSILMVTNSFGVQAAHAAKASKAGPAAAGPSATKAPKAPKPTTKAPKPGKNAAAGTICSENSFLGLQTPASGSTINAGDRLSEVYNDETPINGLTSSGAVDTTSKFAPTALLAGGTDPATKQAYSNYALPVTVTAGGTTPAKKAEKYTSTVTATLPNPLAAGSYTVTMTAWDSDQNKAGGDCGVASWSFTIAGGGQPGVTISDTNNASGTGFSHHGKAQNAGQSVPWQVVITNTSTAAEKVTGFGGSWALSNVAGPLASAHRLCSTDVDHGLVLQAGQSYTCTFTGQAPTAGATLTHNSNVTVALVSDPTKTATAADASDVTTPAAANQLSIGVYKANDANHDNQYNTSEILSSGANSVPYLVTVTNTSQVPEKITSVNDTWPAGAGWAAGSDNLANADCRDGSPLIGRILQPGANVTCYFAETALPTPGGGPLVDTVTVNAVDASAGASSSAGSSAAAQAQAQATSSSASSSVYPTVLGTTITNPPTVTPTPAPVATAPATLAFTGSNSPWIAALGSNLLALGMLLLFFESRSRRTRTRQA